MVGRRGVPVLDTMGLAAPSVGDDFVMRHL